MQRGDSGGSKTTKPVGESNTLKLKPAIRLVKTNVSLVDKSEEIEPINLSN